jgi:hypothetical protein
MKPSICGVIKRRDLPHNPSPIQRFFQLKSGSYILLIQPNEKNLWKLADRIYYTSNHSAIVTYL